MECILQSLTNDPITMAVVMSSLLFVTGFLRNDYGELSRALVRLFVWESNIASLGSLRSHPFGFSVVGPCICTHSGTNKFGTERLPNSPTPKSDDSTESTQTVPSRRRWS